MLFKKALFGAFAGTLACFSVEAQTFETRSTRYSGDDILNELKESGQKAQWAIRDSVIDMWKGKLGATDTIETFYNGHHLGLVIFRDQKPHELIGFWDLDGNEVDGGSLSAGTGEIKTPFNPELVQNFEAESVIYESGLKNGPVFYYCDCASVLRRGTFTNNKKTGLWKEYDVNGVFVKEKNMGEPVIKVKVKDRNRDWLAPAHCMMQPDLKECPNLDVKGGKSGKGGKRK